MTASELCTSPTKNLKKTEFSLAHIILDFEEYKSNPSNDLIDTFPIGIENIESIEIISKI
jgi:hypothetical protein